MVRTQIQLTQEQMTALKKLAAERGVSVAELVRASVAMLLAQSHGLSREERRRRAMGLPSFHSGVSDLSARHDDYFAEAVLDLE